MVSLYKALGGGWVSDAERMGTASYGEDGFPVKTGSVAPTMEPPP